MNQDERIEVFTAHGDPGVEFPFLRCAEFALSWVSARDISSAKGTIASRVGDKLRVSRWSSVKNIRRRLLSDGTDNVIAVDLSLIPPGADVSLLTEFEAYAMVKRESRQLAIFQQEYASAPDWVGMGKQLINLMTISYAYAYLADRYTGPIFNVGGIGYTRKGMPLTKRKMYRGYMTRRWGDLGLKRLSLLSEQGCIRKVYPFQILNSSQLAHPVGDIRFDAWVAQDPARGTLEPLAPGLAIWRVKDDPDLLESLNLPLYRASMLLGWWPEDEPEPPYPD